jgi:hypothetical protein
MKKKIDISSVVSSLRGESVFFPTKNGKPAPEHAGEPIENKEDDSLPANQQDSLLAKMQTSKDANQQAGLPANQQRSKLLKKFSSYLTEDSLKGLKRIAFETEKKDYEVLQEAVDFYLERLKK